VRRVGGREEKKIKERGKKKKERRGAVFPLAQPAHERERERREKTELERGAVTFFVKWQHTHNP
jgi:hypothetical protein